MNQNSMFAVFVCSCAGLVALVPACDYTTITSLPGTFDAAGFGSAPLGGPSLAAEFGATQGGAQDLGLARELIASGQVPPAEAFVVEGMFSEHDLGLTGEACARVLCLRAALGVAPAADGEASGWVQVGMSSTIDMETFRRPSLTVIATVDISGSMGWGYVTENSEYPTPGEVSRNLLSAIAAELGAGDEIAIVTYGTTVKTPLGLTRGDDQVTIQASVDALSTGGVTDMEGGLRRAYEIARTAGTTTDETRILLFTDIQPNVGATSATEFEQIVTAGATDGIGITVFGVGVGMRQELLNAMSHIRGGNAFSLFDNDDVGELMDDDWPWLVSPIAYDLTLDLTPAGGFTVADAYGFPAADGGTGAGMDVSTIFLSRRKGALLVRLTPETGTDLTGLSATGQLSYETPEGEPVTETLQPAYQNQEPDDREQFFEQASVGKSVALAVLVAGMRDAAEVYGEDPSAAIAAMQTAVQRITADAAALGDTTLAPEIELAEALLQLMEDGAEQGDLYGQVPGLF